MKKLKFILILVLFPLLSLKCEKDDNPTSNNQNNNKEELPPKTQTGENTFGCLVNGELWLPEVPAFSMQHPIGGGYGKGELVIYAQRNIIKNNEGIVNESLALHIRKGAQNKSDFALGSRALIGNWAVWSDLYEGCDYNTNAANTGILKISKLDSINNIVSGTFEFTVVNDTCGGRDTIRVTEGRFDIKYAY